MNTGKFGEKSKTLKFNFVLKEVPFTTQNCMIKERDFPEGFSLPSYVYMDRCIECQATRCGLLTLTCRMYHIRLFL